MSNNTDKFCHKIVASTAPPLFQNGKITIQAYHIGWVISGSLALVAMITSFWLISKHVHWYTDKKEQRYIVRLLFMVPLYALISFGSFVFWNHATPIILARDSYEAIVLTAFFYLLLMYLDHDAEEQKRIFIRRGMSVEADVIARREGRKKSQWVFPLGFVQWKPKDGLYFLQLMKWGILQYCVIRPTSTLAAVILDYMGLYCESSWGLGWGHIYITIAMSISVTIAMYCLIQLYVTVAVELAARKALLKLFSVKAVVFLTFWQATFLSLLSMFGVVKDTKYMTAEDINIGIGAVLETFEMMLFAFLHIRAFSYKPYQHSRPESCEENVALSPSETPPWPSLAHAMDFRETFREIWIGTIYMFDKIRGREPATDFGIIRETHYTGAFGVQRPLPGKDKSVHSKWGRSPTLYKPTFPDVQIEVDRFVEVEGQRQWLLLGEHDRRTRLHLKRDKSEGLQEQIDRKLEELGYTNAHNDSPQNTTVVRSRHASGRRSWWRTIYSRISQSNPEGDEIEKETLDQIRLSPLSTHQRRTSGDNDFQHVLRNIEDQPPLSMLRPNKVHSETTAGDIRFQAQDDIRDGKSIDENHLALHHHHKLKSRLFIDSPASSGHRASRSSFLLRFPSPKLSVPIGATPRPSAYDDQYELDVPIRSPYDSDDPRQENRLRLSVTGQSGDILTRPSEDTMARPAPLDSDTQPYQKYTQYSWSPPPASPTTTSASMPGPPGAGRTELYSHHSSAHKRQPAGLQ